MQEKNMSIRNIFRATNNTVLNLSSRLGFLWSVVNGMTFRVAYRHTDKASTAGGPVSVSGYFIPDQEK